MAASEEETDLAAETDYEALAYQQRLKAALHYTVGKICEETGAEAGLTFSRQFVAALTETSYRQCESFAVDLELFAKHAKRSTINNEDVKLLARKSPSLAQHIKKFDSEMTTALEAEKANKKEKKAAKKQQKKNEPTEDKDNDET
ncbi:predicted protein [Nematostella vectensis]|uniref:Centromere protein S n=1 Tax=Nematostella vectensis TaxID=45351 RepID=A7RMQ5_NEMVE|nr:predicted protein [Nematostella vectensis]|eukprot:XP_001639371.1 predicted protein [Nematostella vectensis]